jgi:hypothetical protein
VGIAVGIIIISSLYLYLSWVNNSIREIKEKLSNIETLLKDKNN